MLDVERWMFIFSKTQCPNAVTLVRGLTHLHIFCILKTLRQLIIFSDDMDRRHENL
jgi:hypothetical protein